MLIGFVAGAYYQRKIYLSALNMNAFFSFDPSNSVVELIDVFEKEALYPWLHLDGVLRQNKLWLTPMQAKHVACIALDTGTIAYYNIDCRRQFAKDNLFHGTFAVGKNMYLIPYQTDTLLQVDTETNVISALGYADFDLRNLSKGMCFCDGEIKFAAVDGELRSRLDIEQKCIKKLTNSPLEFNGYRSTLQTETDVWMIPFEGEEIKRYNLQNGTWTYIRLENKKDTFYRGMDLGAFVIFFPGGECRNFVVIRKKDNAMHTINDAFQGAADNFLMGFHGWFEMNRIPSDAGYWASSNDGFIFEFSTMGEIIHTYHINIEKSDLKSSLQEKYQKKNISMGFDSQYIHVENDIIGLDELTDYVVYDKSNTFGEEKSEILQREVHRKWTDMLRVLCR